ncbi:MAG: hypothetical protein EPN91_07570 [Salinibacterium sp.]|nr:MAG: hypothetical protein EPN91_07570 [Salinibacterium sp.]
MAQNVSPPISQFCADFDVPAPPIIRLYGGAIISTQIDGTKGVPGICTDVFSVINKLEPALAAIQPLLTVLDVVAQLGFCFQLAVEAQTNPLKLIDLLKCVPDLITKLNAVLALVPPFPQGIAQIVTMCVDVISTVASIMKCLVNQLTALKTEIQQIDDMLSRAGAAPAGDMKQNLLVLAQCAQRNAQQQLAHSLGALGPIARILCVIKTMLVNTGSDACKDVARQLAFPDPSSITAVDQAIARLTETSVALSALVTVLQTILGPLGIAPPPPSPAFLCPIDQLLNSPPPPPPPPPQPAITSVDPGTGTPTATPTILRSSVGPSGVTIILNGTGFTPSSQVFFGSSKVANVTLEVTDLRLRAVLPQTLFSSQPATTIQLSVLNPATQTKQSDSGPFALAVAKTPFGALNNPVVNAAGQLVGTAATQNLSSNQIPLALT